MRKALSAARGIAVGVAQSWQGVAGVGCVAGGVYMLAGLGWSLVAVGAFLLVGAWGNR